MNKYSISHLEGIWEFHGDSAEEVIHEWIWQTGADSYEEFMYNCKILGVSDVVKCKEIIEKQEKENVR